MEKRIIALIPARAGSERIKHKNIKNFFSHPLLAYAIQSAIKSKIFELFFIIKLVNEGTGMEMPLVHGII